MIKNLKIQQKMNEAIQITRNSGIKIGESFKSVLKKINVK